MTDRPRPSRPSAAPVFWVSTLLFAALFAFLVYRFSAGEDPSLAGATAPRPVEVHKVIKRRVVTTVVPTPGAETVVSGPTSSSTLAAAPEPVTTSAS
ncbi:MAG: hypothetical protein U0R71_07575 [Solirubrobacterales bacterium]